jgi:hypothetical protein
MRELFHLLNGFSFPANKGRIRTYAMGRGANEAMIVALNQLQDGVQYYSIDDVNEAVLNPPHLDNKTYHSVRNIWYRIGQFVGAGREPVLHPRS